MKTYGDIQPELSAWLAAQALKAANPKPEKVPAVKSMDLRCRVCGAQIGERCRPVRRHFNWAGNYHTERIEDAVAVTNAKRALLG